MKIGDGIFRHVVIRRELSWSRADHSHEIHVSADAEAFIEPNADPHVPLDFTEPKMSLPFGGGGFTRAQWEELKREGDQAFADFDARFAQAPHSHTCPLCDQLHKRPGRLCAHCDGERLVAASASRGGGHLTYTNAADFSESNWIKLRQAK